MENNIAHTESGERLSFFKLFAEKKYRIEIPIIQRDYAQGRESNTEIRNTFLEALKGYLEEKKPNRDLDFIYGSLLNDDQNKLPRFVPLDGQQRLTTLFLLHWYMAIKEDKLEDFRNHFTIPLDENKWQSKFTYETRTSAKEFCNALVSAEIKFKDFDKKENNSNTTVSGTIKNQQWYFLSWKNDPTVQGMLVMLDAIHFYFKDELKEKDFYTLLTNLELPIITFQFLKLENLGLTDDLYIKMNARGKPLTSFENFKAKFEQQIKLPEYENKEYILKLNSTEINVPLHEYFSHKIDTNWANLFWAYLKDELQEAALSTSVDNIVPFDDMVMNLFKTFAINHVAGKLESEASVRDLIKTKSEELSFIQFKKHNCFNPQSIPSLVCLLDILQNEDKKAKQFIPDFYYFDENLLERFLKNDFKTAVYAERIYIHAYFEYLIKWSTNGDFNDTEGFKKWMRIIHNLIENTAPYNNEREFTNSIKGINSVLTNNNNIHKHLIQDQVITGFDPSQVKEEILKIYLIEKNIHWENLIFKAEQHGYFKGQIGFLLRLCGVTAYYNEKTNCNWDDSQDTIFRNSFENYFSKAARIFGKSGLRDVYSKKGRFIWERALLSIGNFLIQEGRNQSFLIDKDRDISWKRLLKGDKNTDHPKIVRKIFDALDVTQLKNSLQILIDSFNGDSWKSKYIETPELLYYLGPKRYIRLDSPQGHVLLKGERMSGKHAELYTYHLYLNCFQEEQIQILPFTKTKYEKVTGDSEQYPPHIAILEWAGTLNSIKISFEKHNYKIQLNIPDTENNDIVNLLINKNLRYSVQEILGYDIYIKSENEVITFINELSTELQNLTT